MTSSMDDSDDEFDQLAPPDNELDKVYTLYMYMCIHLSSKGWDCCELHVHKCTNVHGKTCL